MDAKWVLRNLLQIKSFPTSDFSVQVHDSTSCCTLESVRVGKIFAELPSTCLPESG